MAGKNGHLATRLLEGTKQTVMLKHFEIVEWGESPMAVNEQASVLTGWGQGHSRHVLFCCTFCSSFGVCMCVYVVYI